jgi:putative membrane protein
LTVYLFMQVFALYVRGRGPVTQPERTTISDLQAVLLYAATTVSYFVTFFTAEHTTVTDAAGVTWRTADIYETSVLLTVYGMVFMALLALLRIAQRHSTSAGRGLGEESLGGTPATEKDGHGLRETAGSER